MRNLLLIITAVVGVSFIPLPAQAAPLVGAVAAVGTWWSALAPIAQAAIQLGAGLVLSNLTAQKQPKQADLKRDLQVSRSTPAKRFVYGHYATTGTPAPWRVKGRILYGCLILNSRPSAGTNIGITVDGRDAGFAERGTGAEITVPVDLFDFESDGELVEIKENFPDWDSDEEQLVAWLGLGDQTEPPDRIVTEAPGLFAATDGWQGCTVLWVRISAGGSVEKRPKRWPNVPPSIEIEMDWSLIWDPEDVAQDKDDPDTWTYSDNQARCLLDAVRFNPVRSYGPGQMIEAHFTDAVPLADENVVRWHDSVEAGETVNEKRYRVAGVVDWSKGELLDMLQPLADAGGGQLCISTGKLSYIPGEYHAPTYTMTDVLSDSSIDFQAFGSRRDVPYAIKGTWTASEREYETAELSSYPVPGGSANADDVVSLDLPLVPSGTQCQRLVKMEAVRRGLQKTLDCTLPPSAIKLVPGSVVTGNVPSPFTRINGTWRVDVVDPAAWLNDADSGKVAFRVPVQLSQYSSAIYEWDPETEEAEILTQSLTAEGAALGTVSNFLAATVEVDTGGAAVLMIEWSFDEITTHVVDEYQIAWRKDGETNFTPLPSIAPEAVDGSTVSGQVGPVTFGQGYDFRARAVGPTSDGLWSYVNDVIAGFQVSSASATAGAGQLSVDFTAPDSAYLEGVRLFRAAVGENFGDAVQAGSDESAARGVAQTVVFTGLAAGESQFWILPYTQTNTDGTATSLGTFTLT